MFELNNCLQLVLDIHELGDLKSYKTTDHGYSGKSYIIESSKGIYFIKFYKKSRPIYQIEFEHEVTKIISSKALEDCPVLPPLTNKNFQSWFLLENCYVSVFPYIQGFSIESGNFSYRQVYFAAKSLAILHKNLQRINLTRESYYQWKLAYSKSSIQDLAKISKLIELKKKKDEFDKFAMKAIASFTESLLETSKKFEALQRLPGQLTH